MKRWWLVLALLASACANSKARPAQPESVKPTTESLEPRDAGDPFDPSDRARAITLPDSPFPLVRATERTAAGYPVGSKSQLGLGGFATSPNFAESSQSSLPRARVLDDAVALELSDEDAAWDLYYLRGRTLESERHAGVVVRVINRWESALAFDASDSALYMTLQALDSDGRWRDLQGMVSSGCGNSYHSVVLEPGQAWKLVGPRYQGPMKTLLRFKLRAGTVFPWLGPLGQLVPPKHIDRAALPKLPAFFSRPFHGSIDPRQLEPSEPAVLP